MHHLKEMVRAVITTQTLMQKKVFGNVLSETTPLEYRRPDWLELNRGRERSVRLIVRAMLGVPSAHYHEHDYPIWCFQFPAGSLLVAHLFKGNMIELNAKVVDEREEREIAELVDYLFDEVTAKLKTL